jgi:hypothetical protein
MDYQALNAKIVRDIFLVLVVQELSDELHGAAFFTKLDLQSGSSKYRCTPKTSPLRAIDVPSSDEHRASTLPPLVCASIF